MVIRGHQRAVFLSLSDSRTLQPKGGGLGSRRAGNCRTGRHFDRKACWAEKVPRHQPLVLHADNGSPMKGQTLQVKLQVLGIESSYSRPRVSNDNPYSEAIFRTCKYRPNYPKQGFVSLKQAREWVLDFVRWYNEEHRSQCHSLCHTPAKAPE